MILLAGDPTSRNAFWNTTLPTSTCTEATRPPASAAVIDPLELLHTQSALPIFVSL